MADRRENYIQLRGKAMVGLGFIELLVFLSMGGAGIGLPLGMPPGPENPLMTQVAPAECIFYTTWSPTIAPVATNNPTEKWMAQPELKQSIDKLIAAFKQLATRGPQEDAQFAQLGIQIAEKCFYQSAAVYIGDFQIADGTPLVKGGAVFDFGEDANSINDKINDLLAKLAAEKDQLKISRLEINDIQFRSVPFPGLDVEMPITWGLAKDRYFVLTIGPGEMQNLLTNIETPAPKWLSSLRTKLAVDRVSSVSYVNISQAAKLVEEIPDPTARVMFDRLGTKQIKHFGWVTGLDKQGFVMRTDVALDGQPSGLLALFDGQPLKPQLFGKISDDKMVAMATRISPAKAYAFIDEFSKAAGAPTSLESQVQVLNELAGFDFEQDVLANLDDYAYVYGSINPASPAAGWVLSVGAQNEMALADPYEKIINLLKNSVEENPDYTIKESRVGSDTLYSFEDNRGWSIANPIWTFSEGEIIFSLDKSSIRRHLRRKSKATDALVESQWIQQLFQSPPRGCDGPIAIFSVDIPQILRLVVPMASAFGNEIFPDRFEFSFDDLPSIDVLTRDVKPLIAAVYRSPGGFQMIQRQTYPSGSPGTLICGMGVIGLPATMTVRRAMAQSDSANNIRQLALAMHNYADAHGAFPARFSKGAEDKPLLSWRVHLLPYLEQNELYEQFHLDEPWDSEHNKALIERMPDIFQHPRLKLEDGQTSYVVPVGPGAVFGDPEKPHSESAFPLGTRFAQIPDGTSNTIMILVANADNAVIWTKPADYAWEDQMEILAGLRDVWPDEIQFALCDGSVQRFEPDFLTDKIKKLFQKADGEVVDLWNR